jgi:hypothetical protein
VRFDWRRIIGALRPSCALFFGLLAGARRVVWPGLLTALLSACAGAPSHSSATPKAASEERARSIDTPFLGARAPEVREQCLRDNGQPFDSGPSSLGCKVGGVVAYVCELGPRAIDSGEAPIDVVNKCTQFEEGATLEQEVRSTSATYGQARIEQTVNGPLYWWEGVFLVIAPYAKGVARTKAYGCPLLRAEGDPKCPPIAPVPFTPTH